MKKLYVAHTYGRRWGLSRDECESNALRAVKVGQECIKKGWNAFVPNLWHWFVDWDTDFPNEELAFALVASWIPDCDALLVAEMPKWEGSGVAREIAIAEKWNIPVYYSIDDLPES